MSQVWGQGGTHSNRIRPLPPWLARGDSGCPLWGCSGQGPRGVYIRTPPLLGGCGGPILAAPSIQGSSLSFCLTGFYCPLPGLASVSRPCSAGFYCTQGASVPNPSDGTTGDLCPLGLLPPGQPQGSHSCPRVSHWWMSTSSGGLLWAQEERVKTSLGRPRGGYGRCPHAALKKHRLGLWIHIPGACVWRDLEPRSRSSEEA